MTKEQKIVHLEKENKRLREINSFYVKQLQEFSSITQSLHYENKHLKKKIIELDKYKS